MIGTKSIKSKNIRLIIAPRSFNIIAIQFFGLVILLFAVPFLIGTIISYVEGSVKDIIIGSAVTTPALSLAFSVLFFSQKSIGRILLDKSNDTINILKKGAADKIYFWDEVKCFRSQLVTHSMPGHRSFKLYMEKNNGEMILLFSEDLVFTGNNWNDFASKLSFNTNINLKKEYLTQDILKI